MDVDPGFSPQTVSHYRILRKIGSGGMGDVYEAEDIRLGRHVALKFLPEGLIGDPQALDRFEREARAASALNHPNICTIYEIDEADGRHFIAMELLEGETLRSRLWSGPLPLNTLLDLAIQIASAMDAAHASGVIHRDIKPENIFLSKLGHVKILDFGVAKMAIERRRAAEMSVASVQPTLTARQNLTASGVVVGTTSYMSPEQVRGEELDARSDLFSFGAVLYEMATGKRAFPGKTIGLICEAILNREPEPAVELNPQIPQRLEEVIEKALEKDVQVRYQSAADIRADLIRLKRLVDSDARTGTNTSSLRSQRLPATAARSTRYATWPLWALLSVVAIAVLGYFFWQPRRGKPSASSPMKQIRLTANSLENPVDGAAISPDGRYLAYSDRGGIHIKTIAGGDTRHVPPPEGLVSGPNTWYPVAWHPNGSKFIATAVNGAQGSTWEVSLLGGKAQLLRDGAWAQAISPDGNRIAYLLNMDFAGGHEIWTMGAQGEDPQKLLDAGDNNGFVDVSYSPDGKGIAYLFQEGTTTVRLRIRELQSGATHDVMADPRLRSVMWIPDGRLVYSLGRTVSVVDADLWALSLDEHYAPTGAAHQITNWPGSGFSSFSVTPGGKLAFLRMNFESDVYVADLDSKSMALSRPKRLTLDEHNDMPTAWTPDGKAVLFFSDREGPFNIYKQAIDQEMAEALTSGPGYKWGPRMNGEGTAVVYLTADQDPLTAIPPTALKKVSLNGGPPDTILTSRATNDHRCSRGPNPLCLFDELSTDGRQRTLYTYDETHGRGREIISYDANPYSNWDLSPDGKTIAISRFDPKEGRIRFLSLEGKSIPDVVVKNWSAINSLDWTADGKAMLISSSNSRGATLLYLDMNGNARPLWSQSGGGQIWGIPSPSGRHMALLSGSFDSNAWMIENF